MQHGRERIRALTARERLGQPVEAVVQDLNSFLRGWTCYFRYGNSARDFDKIRHQALNRLGLFLNPNGSTVGPRPIWGWRERPNAAGEGRR